MPTTINNCVFLSAWNNWADAPDGERAWKTAVGPVVDGSEQRQGLRAAAHRSQSGRITAATLARRATLDAEITDAIATGRACAARIGWSSPVLASTTTTVDLPDTVAIAALDHVVIRIDRVPYPRQVSAVATPSAGVRRLTVAALPSAPAVGERVWPMLFGTPSLSRIRALDGAGWDLQLTLEEPIGTGDLGTSDSCTPAPLQEIGTGFNLCGHPTEIEADLDVDCGLVKCVLRWSQVSFANGYRISRSAASMSPRTPVTLVGGGTFSYEVERDTQGWYYVVTAISGEHESAESDEVYVPPTTIEGVMRAVQERLLATEDATHGISPTAIVWPDRDSDSTSPGDYPADGFYTADITGDDARATELVEAINDAILDAWLERYATTDAWTGLAAVADIPRWTRAGLELVDNSLITSANWETRLYELAAAVCQLEHQVRLADLVDGDQRNGASIGRHWDQATDTRGQQSFGAYYGAAMNAWEAAGWFGEGMPGSATVTVVDLPIVPFVGGPAVVISAPGLDAEVGSFGAAYLENWAVQLFSWRAKVEADLAPSLLGDARVYLKLDANGESLPRPVVEIGTLQTWQPLSPGTVVKTRYLDGTENVPPPPEGAGETYDAPNQHHEGPTFKMLISRQEWWQVAEQVVRWTRSHRPSAGHWTHYP